MDEPEPQSCCRCGAPVDATDSVKLPDGPTCIVCVDKAARQGAVALARQRLARGAAGWSGLSVLAMVGSRFVLDGPGATVLGALGAVGLVLAAWTFWRLSGAKLTS